MKRLRLSIPPKTERLNATLGQSSIRASRARCVIGPGLPIKRRVLRGPDNTRGVPGRLGYVACRSIQ